MGVSWRTVAWLKTKGHEAIHLRDEGLHQLPDSEILKKAIDEKRVLPGATASVAAAVALVLRWIWTFLTYWLPAVVSSRVWWCSDSKTNARPT